MTTVCDARAPKSAGEKTCALGLLITWLPNGNRLRTFDCPLRNLNRFVRPKTGQYKIWTADCGLGVKYGLGIKRGLENMDWV